MAHAHGVGLDRCRMPGADGVSAVARCSRDGKIEFGLVVGVNSIERLALLDAIADLAEQLDAGALVDRRARGPRQAVQLQAVDLGNGAVIGGTDVEGQLADIVAAGRGSLRVDDFLHFLQRRAAVEQFAGARVAGTATQLRVVFQQMRGKPQRLFAQVGRGVRLVGQNGHDVVGFQHRTDAVADRLAAVGRDHLDGNAELVADELEQLAQAASLSVALASFAVGPTGRSIRRWVEPAASFFDMIEATICSRVSRQSGRSTEMRMSSAGDRLTCPPQTRQPRHAATTSFISSTDTSTRASTSMVSAVPAGEVIAREDVFGMVRPCAATIGTTIMEVRFPGMPPMQCLSTTMGLDHFSCVPAIGHRVDQSEQFAAGHEAGRTDQERGDLHVRIAIMREVLDDGVDFGRLERSTLDLAANGIEAFRRAAGLTVTRLPTGSAKRRNAGSESPISSDPTRASSSVIRSVASNTFEPRCSSTRLKPRKISGRNALE